MRLGGLIDAFRPAEGPPPQTLGALLPLVPAGAWPMLWSGRRAVSALAGATEVVSALILGWVVDAAVDREPRRASSPTTGRCWSWFAGLLPRAAPAGLRRVLGLELASSSGRT